MFRYLKALSILAVPALLLMSAGAIWAADANDAYVPVPAPGKLLTQWAGSENLCNYGPLTFHLYAGGRVVMIDAQTTTDGTYQQNGQLITMWFAGGRVVYTGTTNANGMSGTAQSGRNCWSWSVAAAALSTPVEPPTQWVGGESLCGYGQLTFQMYAGGRAVMLDAKSILPGTYEQNGQQITLRFDCGRVVYTGYVNGNVMYGNAANACSAWTWNLQRQPGA